MYTFLEWFADIIGYMGYPGIVFLMFIESSCIPFPSELVIPPAGYLISQNRMSWTGVVLSGTIGSVLGALFNYAIALYLGRPFMLKYGRYFGISQRRFIKGENFFLKHGSISTFIGRLIFGIRQYISLPAGLARMNLGKFCLYTAFGASIWVWVLAYIGYFVGNNKERITEVSRQWGLYILAGCILLIVAYIFWRKRRKQDAPSERI